MLNRNKKSALFITCNHVVSFPDTALTFFEGPEIPSETFVQSVSIKQKQSNILLTKQSLEQFEIIATDPRSYLALLTATLENTTTIFPLSFSAGNSEWLKNGSFLYTLGFPKGYPMITRSIASPSHNDRYFLTDGLFNPGISGGLIIASNDNFETFHWVGLASSAAGERETILVPHPETELQSGLPEPYHDSLFVQEKTRISYGITQAIPINQIKRFLRNNRRIIRSEGFNYAVD